MIDQFGWGPGPQQCFAPLAAQGLLPARVTAQHRGLWELVGAMGDTLARVSGRFAHEAEDGGYPTVGDWVGADASGSVIHAVAPRRGVIARQDPQAGVQVLCAQVDMALLAMSLNQDLNARRLERYLAAVRAGGVEPLVVLTKADLATDRGSALATLADSLGETPALRVSAESGEGLEALQARLAPGMTAALLGSSGVGKSTLLNRLMGREIMATGAIREDDAKGRHTTRHRELFRLPWGALLIDTPGLRQFGLADADGLEAAFADVTALFGQCRFRGCGHAGEPGCAVEAAVSSSALTPARWRAYQKLQREQAFENRRGDAAAEAAHRAKWKTIHRQQKAKNRLKDRNAGWDDA